MAAQVNVSGVGAGDLGIASDVFVGTAENGSACANATNLTQLAASGPVAAGHVRLPLGGRFALCFAATGQAWTDLAATVEARTISPGRSS